MISGNQILDFEDPKMRAHKALKKFVLTVASTRGLGDEIVNMYTAMDPDFKPQNLLELEQDLERELARLRSPELVGA